MEQQNGSGSDHTPLDSSEGFTSFFTTTNSGTQSEPTNCSSSQSSDFDKKPAAAPTPKGEKGKDAENDASSMVVLARVKRKDKKADDSGNSSSSCEKRVRILERREEEKTGEEVANAKRYYADANGESSASSSSHSSSNMHNAARDEAHLHMEVPAEEAPLHMPVPPRIVTDVSSSKTSSATSSNVNTSGSNTGSGSNQGSSASGNDDKGNREGLAQEDNSGESPDDRAGQAHKKSIQATYQLPEVEHKHDGAGREKKLQDKKRKRIEMRREYEAQQDMDSSASSSPTASLIRPGRPVTMDQVLLLSNIAR
jgi:hypothetical protein